MVGYLLHTRMSTGVHLKAVGLPLGDGRSETNRGGKQDGIENFKLRGGKVLLNC